MSSRLFPDRSLLPHLIAGPRDPVIKGQLVYSATDPTAFGPGFAGDVALAGTLPVLRLAGSSPRDALVVGLEAAVFARFAFAVIQRELVNTDWIFTVPLVWHRGPHWLRARYYHTSSHLGDQYGQRFDQEPARFARDGADLTAYASPRPGLGLYALAFLSVNAHPVPSQGSHFRAGFEIDPGRREPWGPFAAVDLRLEDADEILPLLSAQTGLWLPHPAGRPLRLALELVAGRSAMGQFHGLRSTQLGVGLFWNP